MTSSSSDSLCSSSGTTLLQRTITTPIGEYTVAVCGDGVHSVERMRGKGFSPDLSVGVSETECRPDGKSSAGKKSIVMLQKITEWFHLYFEEPSRLEKSFPNSVSICVPSSTEFQKTVWETLRDKVTLGSTISYGELAGLTGHPKAARAVGSAMRNNPNCILVPCHRVIRSNSEMGNYNGGVEIKEWLLDFEKTTSENGKMKGGRQQPIPKP